MSPPKKVDNYWICIFFYNYVTPRRKHGAGFPGLQTIGCAIFATIILPYNHVTPRRKHGAGFPGLIIIGRVFFATIMSPYNHVTLPGLIIIGHAIFSTVMSPFQGCSNLLLSPLAVNLLLQAQTSCSNLLL